MTTPETTEHMSDPVVPATASSTMLAHPEQTKIRRSQSARLGKLSHATSSPTVIQRPTLERLPWLDNQTAAEVDAIVEALARSQPEVLAVIAFGSVARHDERPLTDPEPSDVDLLLVVTPGMPEETAVAIHHTMGMAGQPFGYTPRAIEPLLVAADLKGWDSAFVANILSDGVVLWARDRLPEPLTLLSVADVPPKLTQ